MMDSKSACETSGHELVGTVAKMQARDGNRDDGDSDEATSADDAKGEIDEQTTQLRREKRLSMNRESARARRKRTKILIETLEHQVAELSKSNQHYRHKVSELEKELMLSKQTIQILSRSGIPIAQQRTNAALFGHPQQTPPTFGGDGDQSHTLRRLLEIRNHSVLDQNNAGATGQSGATAEQFLLERIGLPSHSQHGAGSWLPSMAPTGAAAIDRIVSHQLEDFGSRLGVPGPQNMHLMLRPPMMGTASTMDNALAREQLMMLQQQQSESAALRLDRAAFSGDSTTRAILLRQLLQEQELSLENRRAAGRGA